MYFKDSLDNCIKFYSATQLSLFFNMSKRFGTDIIKKLKSINMPALIYNNTIISIITINKQELVETMPKIFVKNILQKKTSISRKNNLWL